MTPTSKFRLKEAFSEARKNGIKTKKIELAEELWPGRNKSTLQVNMTSLLNGNTKRIEPEWIPIICKKLGTTSEFLFGI